ncbi:unnamed protein product [Rhizoctonia solani]|uniref:Fork-head domain-containing protein n=1 Tax=Rhizoctonia solani TaxID=456999 RepID=A0A8H3GFS1_9AGAM|nr:unnamed protein product [Rhizoctonia solani]
MNSKSAFRDRGPQVVPELFEGRLADNMGDDLSPSSSNEALQPATDAHAGACVDKCSYKISQPEMDPELAGLGALEDGRPGERPAYPFTTLIRYAIKGSPNGRLLLEDIYNAIQTRYSYFATAPSGWKNSVRHTLSLMTCFEKVPRLLTEPGKGSYWTVNDSMPHAKPSRVRIRKRKARTEDDILLETSRSVPDALHPESSDGESPKSSDRLSPYDTAVGSAHRHSSYVHEHTHDLLFRYKHNMDGVPHSYRYRWDGSWVEGDHPSVVDERRQERGQPEIEPGPSHGYNSNDPQVGQSRQSEQQEGPIVPEERGSSPVNYRLVLMADLEKLRDALSRRDDIDDEWCRLMVERVRGTGLL